MDIYRLNILQKLALDFTVYVNVSSVVVELAGKPNRKDDKVL